MINRNTLLLTIACGVASLAAIHAAETPQANPPAAKAPPKDSPFAKVTDDPRLPRVLLIGDSISIGYTVPVRKLLAGKANVHRIGTNGGPTIKGLANIDEWLGEGHWDVIHFNWGLHDLRKDTGSHQVPIDRYERNLATLVGRLQKTGAKLIWCSTTPVPEGAARRTPGDEVRYNAAAARVMKQAGIDTNDLYSFAKERLDKIQRKADVHYSAKGSQVLGQEVARHISAALRKAKQEP